MYGHNVQFTTGNYDITTTPEVEYKIATGVMPCGPETDVKDKAGRAVRVIRRVEDLQQLPTTKDAGLLFIEILALVSHPCASLLPSHTEPLFDPAGACAGRCSTLGPCSRFDNHGLSPCPVSFHS